MATEIRNELMRQRMRDCLGYKCRFLLWGLGICFLNCGLDVGLIWGVRWLILQKYEGNVERGWSLAGVCGGVGYVVFWVSGLTGLPAFPVSK